MMCILTFVDTREILCIFSTARTSCTFNVVVMDQAAVPEGRGELPERAGDHAKAGCEHHAEEERFLVYISIEENYHHEKGLPMVRAILM